MQRVPGIGTTLVDASLEDPRDAQLSRFLLDVRGLVMLPALCKGKPIGEILARFGTAIEASSPIEAFAACAAGTRQTIRVARLCGTTADARVEEVHGWFSEIEPDSPSVRRMVCGSLGELSVAYQPLGRDGTGEYLIAAARDPQFPNPHELIVLETAAALMTTALEAAAAESEREATVKAKNDFLALLGHELRNPLAPLVNALDLMQLRRSGVTSREELVMRRQVEHLGTLVDDLLDMSKLSRGSLTLQATKLEIAHVIDDAVRVTAPLFEAQGHTLSVHVPAHGLPVDADRMRLARALEILLANASKHTPASGQVLVQATLRRNRVFVSVRDDGAGINAATLPHVFDSLSHGQRDSKPHYGGLGAGLALTRTLVELHGGSVSAKSAGHGRGSEFMVDLPLADADVEGDGESYSAPNSHWPDPAPAPAGRIFILDDNIDAAQMLGETLSLAGYQVQVERDSSRALDAVRRFRPQFAILDIGMPELNGYDVAKLIRGHMDQPPTLLALSGYGQPSDHQRSAQAGFAVHLVKPVDMTTLLRIIRSVAATGATRAPRHLI